MHNWLNRAECMEFNLKFPPEMKNWTDDIMAGISVKTVNAAGAEVGHLIFGVPICLIET